MPKYIINKGNLIAHDGLYYDGGDVVEMTEAQALQAARSIEGPAPAGAVPNGKQTHPRVYSN